MGEWEGATLRNSHTKCNGLFPIYGPGVRYSAARVMQEWHASRLVQIHW
jgi:hypothetical protein